MCIRDRAKRALAARNLVEAMTWSFIAHREAELFGGGKPELVLANPIAAELSDMRPSLIPGLVTAAQKNADRSLPDVGLFEVGQVFRGDAPGAVSYTHLYYGDFYTYRYLNPWPRPYQKPHPPCYIVGTGSPETVELAAKLGFGYSAVFVSKTRALELNQQLRKSSAEHGHHIRPEQLPLQAVSYTHLDVYKRQALFLGQLAFQVERIVPFERGILDLDRLRVAFFCNLRHGVCSAFSRLGCKLKHLAPIGNTCPGKAKLLE